MKEVFENVCKKMGCKLVEFNGGSDHFQLEPNPFKTISKNWV